MKAIILAAGFGSRLGEYTAHIPKCMLPFGDKSLLQRQVDTIRSAGIDDIVVVRGYLSERIDISGVQYRENPRYTETNMVASLLSARDVLESGDEVLVAYADIIYEVGVLESVARSNASVSVAVDDDWIDYWKARHLDWRSDIESLEIENGKIVRIGDPDCDLEHAHGRYVGLMKFSPEACTELLTAYDELSASDDGRAWRHSRSFVKAQMTCMLNELIDRGVSVVPVMIHRGWLEFDTVEDYERAQDWIRDDTISRFIRLSDSG